MHFSHYDLLLAPTVEEGGTFEGEFTMEGTAEKGPYVVTLNSK